MRTRLFYILVVFLSCMSFSSYAQLQVLGDGRVQIGTFYCMTIKKLAL